MRVVRTDVSTKDFSLYVYTCEILDKDSQGMGKFVTLTMPKSCYIPPLTHFDIDIEGDVSPALNKAVLEYEKHVCVESPAVEAYNNFKDYSPERDYEV